MPGGQPGLTDLVPATETQVGGRRWAIEAARRGNLDLDVEMAELGVEVYVPEVRLLRPFRCRGSEIPRALHLVSVA